VANFRYPQYEKAIAYWIDKRPVHWEERKLKFSVKLINEKVDASDSALEYIGLESIESWTGKKLMALL
jgi:type I restriction enzyme S subunit